MLQSFDIWKMLAGVAFFLLAMNFMESTLGQLAGRNFKLFLKKQTSSKVKAIGGGALVTGLLQSSSIANLLVLSMVGAGVVQMENALALMLGSNLGSTLNSWILATLGFSYNIEIVVLPVIAITGIGMAFMRAESKWYLWFKFFFSLAFLFVALGFIKSGMEEFVKQTDLSAYLEYPLVVFLLLGIFLTTIAQSSSATIALTLSALYTNAITLLVATTIVLGSEIGTTLKLFLASAKGPAIKKRVALGNFLFNLITVIIIFLFLRPLNRFISDGLVISDNLIALVFFQSLVNLFCVILFYPFLRLFGKFLVTRFTDSEDGSIFISRVPVHDTDLALEALENETRYFIGDVMDYSLDSFGQEESIDVSNITHQSLYRKSISEKYNYIKHLHGEMHGFSLKLQNVPTDNKKLEKVDQLIAAMRNTMYAAKNIRDAGHDIAQIRNSSNNIKYGFYTQSAEKLLVFSRNLLEILNEKDKKVCFEKLNALFNSVTAGYSESIQLLYKENLAKQVSEVEISTLINLNRALYTFFKSLLFASKDYLLDAKQAEYFEAMPGFIR